MTEAEAVKREDLAIQMYLDINIIEGTVRRALKERIRATEQQLQSLRSELRNSREIAQNIWRQQQKETEEGKLPLTIE